MTWLGFAGVFAVFFATHSIPVRPRVKAMLVGWLGARGFTIAYSILSILVLTLLIVAAGRAPYVQLWPQAMWQHYIVIVGMFVVCVILGLSLGRPNPFSFGGANNEQFDPSNPGIVRLLRHPILAALTLWATLHLLPNGNLAHVLLFGVFAIFALLGRSLIDRRKKREMGGDVWQDLQSEVLRCSPTHALRPEADVAKRLLFATAAFVTLVLLHPLAIGVGVL